MASFSYLSPTDLGWDLTVQVWNKGKVTPSYTASMGDYTSTFDVPWVIEGFEDRQETETSDAQNPNYPAESGKVQYVAIRSLTVGDAKRLWGRGTLVLEVVSLDDWVKKRIKVE
jgi:hypothetical protein